MVYEPLLTFTWLNTSAPLFWLRIADYSRGISSYTGAQYGVHACQQSAGSQCLWCIQMQPTTEEVRQHILQWLRLCIEVQLTPFFRSHLRLWQVKLGCADLPRRQQFHCTGLSRTDNGPASELGQAGAALPLSGENTTIPVTLLHDKSF